MTTTPADEAAIVRAALTEAGWTLTAQRTEDAGILGTGSRTAFTDPTGRLGVEVSAFDHRMGSRLFPIPLGDTDGQKAVGVARDGWSLSLMELPAEIILAAATAAAEAGSATVAELLTAAGWRLARELRTEDGESLLERAWISPDRTREVEYLPPCHHEDATWLIHRPRPGHPSSRHLEDVDATCRTPAAAIAAAALTA